MYIPANRIKPNLYTRGNEYVRKSNRKNYIGFYYSLWNGRFFTGKTQNDKPNEELIEVSAAMADVWARRDEGQIFQHYASNYDGEVVPGQSQNMIDIDIYNFASDTDISVTKLIPQQSYPLPTEDDYLLGVFTRYFAVKANELQYLELDHLTYQKLNKKSINWMWEMYPIFSIQWTLIGDQTEVARANRNQILIAEQSNKRLGLNSFLRKDYLKFYKYNEQTSLFTEGGEYINRATGQEYIGYYHIHPLKGPMVGQFHTSTNHNYLDPLISTTSIETTDSPITGSASSPPSTNSSNSSPSGGGY
tara:strand:+ start:462 stop:1373 length:912 start_codon:yes stop_codon:yes gene_type:complete